MINPLDMTATPTEIADYVIEAIEGYVMLTGHYYADWSGQTAISEYCYDEFDMQTADLFPMTEENTLEAEELIETWLLERAVARTKIVFVFA